MRCLFAQGPPEEKKQKQNKVVMAKQIAKLEKEKKAIRKYAEDVIGANLPATQDMYDDSDDYGRCLLGMASHFAGSTSLHIHLDA